MKVIFLDIDGVLNGYSRLTGFITHIAKILHIDDLIDTLLQTYGIQERRVYRLVKIVKATNARLVVSSSWRQQFLKPREQQKEDVKKLINLLEKYGMEVYDITTPVYLSSREEEIRTWLSIHPTVRAFVVLDDEQEIVKGFIGKELVRTSATTRIEGKWEEDTGLKHKHIKQAISILNREKEVY